MMIRTMKMMRVIAPMTIRTGVERKDAVTMEGIVAMTERTAKVMNPEEKEAARAMGIGNSTADC